MNAKDERMWGMLVHLSSLAGLVIPFGTILGPLVIWLIKRDQSYFVDQQGKEALNFNISITIYYIASFILFLIFIGYITALATFVVWVVCLITAAVNTNKGVPYRYPLTIRFIK